jgi:phage tail-like protein
MPSTGTRQDPALAFRFEVQVDKQSLGGFSECSGLQLETEVQDYAEGGANDFLLKFPSRTKQANITLKRGIVDRQLWAWHYDLTQGKVRLRSGSILVRDPSGERIVMEWQFKDAFPCKWMGPDLNAGQSNVAVETLELCHQGLERRQ